MHSCTWSQTASDFIHDALTYWLVKCCLTGLVSQEFYLWISRCYLHTFLSFSLLSLSLLFASFFNWSFFPLLTIAGVLYYKTSMLDVTHSSSSIGPQGLQAPPSSVRSAELRGVEQATLMIIGLSWYLETMIKICIFSSLSFAANKFLQSDPNP